MAQLLVRVGIDGTGFQAGMAALERRAAKMNTNLASSMGRAFAVGAAVAVGRSLINNASSFEDMAASSGTTAENMQKIAYAAKQSGSEVGDFQTAMQNLAKARSEALQDPSGDKAQAFGKLGINIEELRTLRDMGALLVRVSDGVKKVNLDANSTPVILSLIGAKNTVVLPAMQAGLRAAGDEAERLNLIMGGGTTSTLDKVGDKMEALSTGIRKVGADILTFLIMPFTTIHTAIMQIPAAFELVAGYIQLGNRKLQKEMHEMGIPGLGNHDHDALIKKSEERIAFAKSELDRLTNEHLDIFDPKAGKPKPGIVLPDPDEDPSKEKSTGKGSSIFDSGPDKSPFSMSADSLTRVGGFAGGAKASIIGDILGRQQLKEQRDTNAILLRMERNLAIANSPQIHRDTEGSL
jgi:hypothetical protein